MGKARDKMVRGTASECNFTGANSKSVEPSAIGNESFMNHRRQAFRDSIYPGNHPILQVEEK